MSDFWYKVISGDSRQAADRRADALDQVNQLIRFDGRRNLLTCMLIGLTDGMFTGSIKYLVSILLSLALIDIDETRLESWTRARLLLLVIPTVLLQSPFIGYISIHVLDAVLLQTSSRSIFRGSSERYHRWSTRRSKVLPVWTMIWFQAWHRINTSPNSSFLIIGILIILQSCMILLLYALLLSIICLAQMAPDSYGGRAQDEDAVKILVAQLVFPMICNVLDLFEGCGLLPIHESRYKYLDLMNPRHVRLLKIPSRFRLVSLRFWNDADFEIVEVPLARAAPYEAISYVWGSGTKRREVHVNGCSMLVTENAYQALKAMRATVWRTRVVWIDSVCINQSNDNEKAVQVALMRDVFGLATRVVGFLGGTPNQSSLAVQALQQVLATREIQGTQYNKLSRRSMLSKWKAITDLLSVPWFHRIWIIQEVAVARKMTLIYGDRSVLWDDLIKLANIVLYSTAAEAIWIKAGISNESFRQCLRAGANIIFMGQLRDDFQRKMPIDRLETLRRGSMFDATVSRDRIYALRGLFRDEKTRSEPHPNYEPDFEFEAWSQHALWLMVEESLPKEIDLNALHYAGVGVPGRIQKLYSWVPDWSDQRIPRRLFRFDRDFQASGSIKAVQIHSNTPRTVQLKGCVVDHIDKVTEPPSNIKISSNIQKLGFHEGLLDLFDHSTFVLHALRLAKMNSMRSFDNESSFDRAFTRTMIADTDANSQKASEEIIEMYLRYWKYIVAIFDFFTSMLDGSYASRGELLGLEELYDTSLRPLFSMNERLQPVFDAFEKRTSPISMEVIDKIREELKPRTDLTDNKNDEQNHRQRNNFARLESFQIQRRFTTTGLGLMGLVPELSMPKDLIVIIFGLSTPCLIRPIEGSIPTMYKFVGPCYIHGMMDGEMMNQPFEEALFELL